jgi:hypothetical protein
VAAGRDREIAVNGSSGVTPPGHDRGAALIVAIGFVVMISMIGAGLTAMVTSGVGNRAVLESIRNRQYAADGAVEEAIASLADDLASGGLACGLERTHNTTANAIDIRVETLVTCGAMTGSDGLPEVQLSGVLSACAETGRACRADDVIVRALVGFEQGADGTVLSTSVHSWSVLR